MNNATTKSDKNHEIYPEDFGAVGDSAIATEQAISRLPQPESHFDNDGS